MADAAIGCWNDKYYWKFWRPLDAIRNGDDDGNRQTWGGIHFRTADEQGVGLGKKVARWESKHYFQRLR